MDILKDKLLIGCLLVALSATSFLIFKNLPKPSISPPEQKDHLSVLKEKANRIHENAFKVLPQTTSIESSSPGEVEQIAKMDAELKALVEADESASKIVTFDPIAETPPKQVKPQGPTSAALNTINSLNGARALTTPSLPMVKKSRPKLGTNEWLVGPGAGADSTEIEPILKNVVDGDIISVSPGTYELNLSMASGSVEINGSEGVIIKLKKAFSAITTSSILLKNLKLEFDSEDNHVSIISSKLNLTFDNVTINENDQTITLNRNTKLLSKNSHFTGTSFVFFDQTEGIFENCFFEKGKTYLNLYNSSKVKIKRSQLMNFSNNAIASQSYLVRFEAENLKVANGTSAFYGKFTDENTEVRDSEFKSLSYFTSQPETKINCIICQKSNIKN